MGNNGKLEQYGIRGGPNPQNAVDISFPPTQLEHDATDTAQLADQLAPTTLPPIWVPYSELLGSGQITRFECAIVPEYWVLYALSVTTRVTLRIAQGYNGQTGAFDVMVSATGNDRFIVPGRDRMLYLLTVANTAQVAAFAIRGFDPRTF